jgi:hypothetical protein
MKKLQVLVVFEFDGIDDVASPEADDVVEEITYEVRRIVRGDWESTDKPVSAWIQDVMEVEERA